MELTSNNGPARLQSSPMRYHWAKTFSARYHCSGAIRAGATLPWLLCPILLALPAVAAGERARDTGASAGRRLLARPKSLKSVVLTPDYSFGRASSRLNVALSFWVLYLSLSSLASRSHHTLIRVRKRVEWMLATQVRFFRILLPILFLFQLWIMIVLWLKWAG